MLAPVDFAAALEAGYSFVHGAGVWGVTSPEGRVGHGPTPEDALLNIDAQIIPDPDTGRRVLHRADGTQVWLYAGPTPDVAEAAVDDDPPAAPEPAARRAAKRGT